jgi:hypothetical protein
VKYRKNACYATLVMQAMIILTGELGTILYMAPILPEG